MRVPILLVVAALATLVMGAVVASRAETGVMPPVDVSECFPVSDMEEYGDPLPLTEFVEVDVAPKPEFPNADELRLIGRISEGVRKIALHKGGGRWWSCGEVLSDEEQKDHAVEWAYRIVYLAWEYSDRGSDDGITINPWGIFGTAANESGFDVCALGPWPRKWGYQHKTITKRRLCISHPYEEIKATMLHPKGIERWKTSGIDAAPLHQLWRCDEKGMCKPKWNRERLPAIPVDDVFSLGKGFEYNVRKMKKDSIDFKTDRPWLYWPGYRSERYDTKVVRWARKGGATSEEI